MADKPDDGPSLEMPSFSLRRTAGPKRRRTTEHEEVAPVEAATPPDEGRREPVTVPTRRADTVPTATQTLPAHEPTPDATSEPRTPLVTLPELPGLTAASATGAVVGALAVLLTWLSTQACDAVRGTSSCGGGPGFLILAAVLVVLAYAGTLLLAAFGVPSPGSTSVLAVGIMAVLVMLFLLDAIFEGWMVVAIPVVAVAAYAGSFWISNAVVDTD